MPRVFGAPLIERGRTDARVPAQFGHRQPRLHAPERLHDLAVRELRLLHAESLPYEKILLLIAAFFGGNSGGVDVAISGHCYLSSRSAAIKRVVQRATLAVIS